MLSPISHDKFEFDENDNFKNLEQIDKSSDKNSDIVTLQPLGIISSEKVLEVDVKEIKLNVIDQNSSF